MNELNSISDFLHATGAQFRIFALGRRIRRISEEEFRRFEQAEAPWSAPLQQSAWLGLLFWGKENPDQQYIWFLRFPLDELGRLQQAARDNFLARLIEQVGVNIEASRQGENMEGVMKDNPFAFTPKQGRLAAFHAQAARVVGKAPSKYYAHAQSYFRGEPGFDQWAFVGMQGIADVAARLDEDDNETVLAAAMAHLPQEPLEALCGCLENEAVGTRLAEALLARLNHELATESPSVPAVVALLRGISNARGAGLRRMALEAVLASPVASDVDVLAAIAGRCWSDLENEALRQAFLEALARNPLGQEAFNGILADLLFIPQMREPMLAGLRNPERSPQLAQAIGALMQGFGKQ